MNLTIDDILSAVQAEGTPEYINAVARCMRLLSEDVIAAAKAGTLPKGDGTRIRWHHSPGILAIIAVPDTAADSTDYDAVIIAQDTIIPGGFTVLDEDIADLIDAYIEG